MNFQKILLSSIIGISLSTQLLASNTHTNDEIKTIAIDAIKTVCGKLKHTLGQKVKKSGLKNAALFCSQEATSLAQKASKDLPKGVTFKRITNKPRNLISQANHDQQQVLLEIETQIKNGNFPKLVMKKLSNNHFQVYKPLRITNKCLACHGDNTTRNKEAYNIISKNYPNDKAINYKFGDLRGAFLVNIKK